MKWDFRRVAQNPRRDPVIKRKRQDFEKPAS